MNQCVQDAMAGAALGGTQHSADGVRSRTMLMNRADLQRIADEQPNTTVLRPPGEDDSDQENDDDDADEAPMRMSEARPLLHCARRAFHRLRAAHADWGDDQVRHEIVAQHPEVAALFTQCGRIYEFLTSRDTTEARADWIWRFVHAQECVERGTMTPLEARVAVSSAMQHEFIEKPLAQRQAAPAPTASASSRANIQRRRTRNK